MVKQEPQNWGEIYAKAPAAVAAGSGPDMLFAIPDFAPILKATGALTSVADFVGELDKKHNSCRAPCSPIPMMAASGPCRSTT